MLNDSFTITPVASGNTSATAVAATANMRLMGFVVRESSGTPAVTTLNICHGTSNTTVVAPITLLASTTLPVWFGTAGIPCPNGVYLERTSGNATITFYTKVI